MAISFEEAALAWARQVSRAENAEMKVKELEAKLEEVMKNKIVRLPDKKE